MNKQLEMTAGGRAHRAGAAAAALCLLAATLAGCTPTSRRFESNFGKSVRASVATQTANPAAVRNRDPVAGMDGQAARAAHGKYVKSFAAPVPQQGSLMNGGNK